MPRASAQNWGDGPNCWTGERAGRSALCWNFAHFGRPHYDAPMGALRQHPSTRRSPLERFAASWRIASWVCWVACFFLACGRETPHLLTLSSIEPPAAEAGDDWTLNGEGFVE